MNETVRRFEETLRASGERDIVGRLLVEAARWWDVPAIRQAFLNRVKEIGANR